MKKIIKHSVLFSSMVALILLSINAAASQEAKTVTGVVNINEATLDQLQLLPGIGPAKANAIVQYRAKRPFKSPIDLIKVKGIGKKLFEKIRANLVIKGKTTAQKPLKKTKNPTR